MTIVRTLLKKLLFPVYLALATSFLLFSLIEVFPGLLDVVHLDAIRYFAQKRGNEQDDQLVYRPRAGEFTIDTAFIGDQYDIDPLLAEQVRAPAIRYSASYKDGFRANSSSPPYDMLVLGDSFVDIGESDDSTFSELVAGHTGLATFNLGRAAYGPYQYKALLTQYLKLRPRYAVVCFFAGNDIEEVRAYEEFLAGGDCGIYVRGRSFPGRYAIAVSDTFSALAKAFRETVIPRARRLAIRDYIGAIRLNDRTVPMRFSYWNPKQSPEELVRSKDWQSLQRVLGEIKAITDREGIELVIVYIPTKAQVYGRHFVERESGAGFLRRIHDQLRHERNTLEAFVAVTSALGLGFVDLDGHFGKLAAEGELLFYPFDTHWNKRGREAAAEYLAAHLRGRDRSPPARPTAAPSAAR